MPDEKQLKQDELFKKFAELQKRHAEIEKKYDELEVIENDISEDVSLSDEERERKLSEILGSYQKIADEMNEITVESQKLLCALNSTENE